MPAMMVKLEYLALWRHASCLVQRKGQYLMLGPEVKKHTKESLSLSSALCSPGAASGPSLLLQCTNCTAFSTDYTPKGALHCH